MTARNQIVGLRDAAGVDGDLEMVAICRIALGETREDVVADMDLTQREVERVTRYERRSDARAECERVLADAMAGVAS